MNELDRKIQEALRQEDAELFKEVGAEPSILAMVMETFRGKHKWLTFLGVFRGLVFMVLFVLAAIQFFKAQETRELLLWAAACIVCLSAVSMMNVWYWLEMNKNAVTREIKRLELQIARLASRIKDRGARAT